MVKAVDAPVLVRNAAWRGGTQRRSYPVRSCQKAAWLRCSPAGTGWTRRWRLLRPVDSLGCIGEGETGPRLQRDSQAHVRGLRKYRLSVNASDGVPTAKAAKQSASVR
jgi:hypothetical protein